MTTIVRAHSIAIVLLLVALAAACSSSTTTTSQANDASAEQVAPASAPVDTGGAQADPATNDESNVQAQGVVVLDAGIEPRVTFAAVEENQATISVNAVEAVDASFGEWVQDDEFTADYNLIITTTPRSNGFELTVERDVRSLVIDAEQPVLDDIAGYSKSHTNQGVASPGITEQERQYNQALRGLLSTPNLVLVVPSEPVGVGAQWTVPMDRLGKSTATVTLTGITDSHVEASLAFTSADDESSFTMTAQGRYSRTTLLADDVSTESTLTFVTQATDNGTLVDVASEQRSTRTYQGASS